jgi:CDP-diacylglycerol--glycerol-3-phosphate 3-phosphatidyltransferase
MGKSGARRPRLDLGAGWSALHHGIDPARVPLLRPWLRLVGSAARPLARVQVPPTVLTVVGPLLAVDALLLAATQPWVALALVVLAAVCDALDGAVAVLSRRASRTGAVADKIADRVADSLFALVMWRCGAPLWLGALAAALSLAHEGFRETVGGPLRSTITVAERPTRVVCAVLGCGCAGLSAVRWPPTVCAAVWVGTGLVGLVQLAQVARGVRG